MVAFYKGYATRSNSGNESNLEVGDDMAAGTAALKVAVGGPSPLQIHCRFKLVNKTKETLQKKIVSAN